MNPNATPEKMDGVWELLREKGNYHSDTTHRSKDGSTFPVEITTTYFVHRGKEYACGYARKIQGR